MLAAAVAWGSIGVLSVGLFRLGLTAWQVAFWRAALAGGLFALGAALLRPSLFRVPRATDALVLIGFGAVGVALFYLSFQFAIALTSVAVSVVLLYTAPVWVMLGARLLLGEPLGAGKLVTMAVVVVGVWATALGALGTEVRVTASGVAWGLVAALSYAGYYLFGKLYVPRYGVPRTLLYTLLSGAVCLGVAAAVLEDPPSLALPAGAWLLLLTLAIACTLLANALYYWGLGRLEAGRAAILASVEPVVAALLALLLLEQALTPTGWVGVALVVGGVAAAPAANLRRQPRTPAEELPTVHE